MINGEGPVRPDLSAKVRDAVTTHLLPRGHRRIGFLGDLETIFTARKPRASVQLWKLTRSRLRGDREALAAHGVPFDPALVQMNIHDTVAAFEATARWLDGDHAPTALFGAQNLTRVVDRLRRLPRHSEVALKGFDDLVFGDAFEHGLTVPAEDTRRLGREPRERLFARIDGERGRTRRIIVPMTLNAGGCGELRSS